MEMDRQTLLFEMDNFEKETATASQTIPLSPDQQWSVKPTISFSQYMKQLSKNPKQLGSIYQYNNNQQLAGMLPPSVMEEIEKIKKKEFEKMINQEHETELNELLKEIDINGKNMSNRQLKIKKRMVDKIKSEKIVKLDE